MFIFKVYNFPGNFDQKEKRMQKERSRRWRKSQFRHRPKLIMRGTKNDENDNFSDLEFETRSEAGEPRGSIFEYIFDFK